VQLYTALIFQGPALIGDIKHSLAKAAPQGLAPMVGSAARDWAMAGC
jgi:dihydroorotate dehydrogenase